MINDNNDNQPEKLSNDGIEKNANKFFEYGNISCGKYNQW